MNCKSGDLALIVGSYSAPENIGRFVIVGSLLKPGDLPYDDGPIWWVSSANGDKLIQWWSGGGKTAEEVIVCLDRHLLPIRPDEPAVAINTEAHRPVSA